MAGHPSCRPLRSRSFEWHASAASARTEGWCPLRLQRSSRPQRTNRTTLPDLPPPASSSSPRRRRPSLHPPQAGERETRILELWPTDIKTFRVDYNPTTALHTKKQGKNDFKAKTKQLGTEKQNNTEKRRRLTALVGRFKQCAFGHPWSRIGPCIIRATRFAASSHGTFRFCPRVRS